MPKRIVVASAYRASPAEELHAETMMPPMQKYLDRWQIDLWIKTIMQPRLSKGSHEFTPFPNPQIKIKTCTARICWKMTKTGLQIGCWRAPCSRYAQDDAPPNSYSRWRPDYAFDCTRYVRRRRIIDTSDQARFPPKRNGNSCIDTLFLCADTMKSLHR